MVRADSVFFFRVPFCRSSAQHVRLAFLILIYVGLSQCAEHLFDACVLQQFVFFFHRFIPHKAHKYKHCFIQMMRVFRLVINLPVKPLLQASWLVVRIKCPIWYWFFGHSFCRSVRPPFNSLHGIDLVIVRRVYIAFVMIFVNSFNPIEPATIISLIVRVAFFFISSFVVISVVCVSLVCYCFVSRCVDAIKWILRGVFFISKYQ